MPTLDNVRSIDDLRDETTERDAAAVYKARCLTRFQRVIEAVDTIDAARQVQILQTIDLTLQLAEMAARSKG